MQINPAIRKLREATGESQQAFATRLGILISAMANYELRGRVPGLLVLSRLHEIADKQQSLAETVREAIKRSYLAEIAKGIGPRGGSLSFAHAGDESAGLMFQLLETPAEFAYAYAFQAALLALRKRDAAELKAALVSLFKAVDKHYPEDHDMVMANLAKWIPGGSGK